MTILVIEDDRKTGDYLKKGLTESGYQVDLARDGADGLHQALANAYELVVLDVMLPGIDGWQVLEQLHAKGSSVPVIVCSGKDNVHDLQRARELGAVAYLVKPFDIDRLIEVTSEVVGLRQTDPMTERGTAPDTELA